MHKRSLAALAAASASLITLAACGSDSSGGEAGADGVEMGPGVTDSEINVALITDLSGPIAEGGIAGALGVQAKMDQVNQAGGVCGRTVVVNTYDTQLDPQRTTQEYRAAEPDNLMISQIVGTAGLNAIQGSIERDKMPTLSASLNYQPLSLPYVYVAMPTFEVELMNGLVWAAEEAGASADNPVKVGWVTAVDEIGQTYQEALNHAASQLEGVEVVAETTYTTGDTDFTPQVSELNSADAEIVIIGASQAQTAGIVGQASQLGYNPTYVSSSGSWSSALAAPLDGLLDNFYISGGYGTLNDDNAGISELTEAVEAFSPGAPPNNFQVGGWINGTVTADALSAACEAGALTRDGVNDAMVDLEVEFQDILPPINFGDGQSIVSYQTRINEVGENGVQEPVTEYYSTDAAESWVPSS